MNRLFDDNGNYTPYCLLLEEEIVNELKKIIDKHQDIDLRDFQLILLLAAQDVGLEVIFSRKK